MTGLHLKWNFFKRHSRRTTHANAKSMTDEEASRQGDRKDLLSCSQGSLEAKTLTCVIAHIYLIFLPLSLTVWQRKPKERTKWNVLQTVEDEKEERKTKAQDAPTSLNTAQPTHQFSEQFFISASAEE